MAFSCIVYGVHLFITCCFIYAKGAKCKQSLLQRALDSIIVLFILIKEKKVKTLFKVLNLNLGVMLGHHVTFIFNFNLNVFMTPVILHKWRPYSDN